MKRLPERIVKRLKRGDVLIRGHATGEDAQNGSRWWFEAPDMEVPPAVAAGLLQSGKIEPQGDGLFGDSQTYRKRKWARL